MRNIKRLFKITKHFKGLVITSVIMILLIQVLGFISPLLIKSVLDDCIMGIEYPWVEISENDDHAVEYNNKYYIQERHLDGDENVIAEVSIVIMKNNYYFINERVINGTREITDSVLTIDGTNHYQAQLLAGSEVRKFYSPIVPLLIILMVAIALKSILSVIFAYVRQMCTNRTCYNLAKIGRTMAVQCSERLPIAYFDSEPAGKMATRITQDVDGLIILYRLVVNIFLSVVLSFVFAYVGMFYLNTKLALLSFLIYPIAFLWIFIYLKYLKKIVVKVNEARSMLTGKINEIINGIQILKIFNFKKKTVDEFNEINTEYKTEQLKEVKLHLVGGWNLINVLKGIITALIVGYFGLQGMSIGGIVITAGIIYAYNEYLLKIIEPINILFTQIGAFSHANVQIDRIYKLIDGALEDDKKEIIPRYQGNVFFDNIWFAYEKNEYVLKGVTFDVKAGQMLGLVGHTGSGKSSLMNLLLRFYDLTDEHSGKIYVDGIDINTYSKRTYREHLGIVLQEPVLFKGTLASNIRFGKNDVSDEEIEKILISIGGAPILAKFSKGIKQEINTTDTNLSAGEKQIISLARVLVHDPAILIMDEATSHIDTETETIIQHALDIVCQNRTVIVIAHRLSTIYNADKIVVLENGLKVEEGTHESLLAHNAQYANIYRSQVAEK